jgi:hypothetical protein
LPNSANLLFFPRVENQPKQTSPASGKKDVSQRLDDKQSERDYRVIDGGAAGRLLMRVAGLIKHPEKL